MSESLSSVSDIEISYEGLIDRFQLWATSPEDNVAFEEMVRCASSLWVEAMRNYLAEPANQNHKEKVMYVGRLYDMLDGPWDFEAVPNFSRRAEYSGRLLAVANEMGPVLKAEVQEEV